MDKDQSRGTRVTVYFSPTEADALRRLAMGSGLAMSAFLRSLALEGLKSPRSNSIFGWKESEAAR